MAYQIAISCINMCLFLLLYSFQYILHLFIRQSGCIGFFAHNSALKFFIEKQHLRIWRMQMFICVMTFALIGSSIIDILIFMLLLLTSTTLQIVAYLSQLQCAILTFPYEMSLVGILLFFLLNDCDLQSMNMSTVPLLKVNHLKIHPSRGKMLLYPQDHKNMVPINVSRCYISSCM